MDKLHALEELVNNHQNRDLIKAKVIIDYLPEIEKAEQQRILFELAKQDDDFSIPVIAYLCHKHPDLISPLPQIEESLLEKAIANPSVILKQLIRIVPETPVYVDLIQKIGIREALPRLRQFLNETADEKLLSLIITALGQIGDEKAVDTIGDFLVSHVPLLQDSAIKALGSIGNEGALRLLYSYAEQHPSQSGPILALFKEIQSESAIHLLNQTLTSSNTDMRIQGKSLLAELGVKAVPVLTDNLNIDHPDLQIHTLNILMDIGDPSSVKAVRNLLNTEPENDNVRFAAFETLAHLPSIKGDYLLATGLTDRDDSIRLAAAKAIDRNLEAVLVGGIKNMVKDENAEAARIIKAIVDAEATNLFIALLEVPYFQKISIEYIAVKVHADVRNSFVEELQKSNKSVILDQINQKQSATEETAQRKIICAVDDSKMILSVYRRVLNELGFEPILFEQPQQCLDWLSENKPIALFTDLNMPEISGMELSRRIRERFDSSSLPIVMVTTQQEGKDDNEAEQIGINDILSKPFDTLTIKNSLQKLAIEC